MTGDVSNAGAEFSAFIEKELEAERARRAALDARGVGVLTTSGTLVTIIFALGALVTSVDGFEPTTMTVWMLAAALAAFVVAAFCGLLANRLRKYEVTQPAQLHEWRDRDGAWNDTADKARRVLAKANILTIASLRQGNNSKAQLVEAALWAQLAAVVLLSLAIAATLTTAL